MRRATFLACSVLLASCSRSIGASPLPAGPEQPTSFGQSAQSLAAISYKTLYSFKSGVDAGYPYSGLINVNGKLYGTTYGGGGGDEWGTVYSMTPSGQEDVLYRFQANSDGAHPYGELVNLNGTLYGTTYQGGTAGAGTVFSITTSGKEKVLYSFKGGTDGQYPYSSLVAVGGELYGTTYQGGVKPGWGVVFKVSTTGSEHVLYRFKATPDGAHPFAGLTLVNGTLYGTTYQGGTIGAGAVFSMTTTGTEHIVYSFKGKKDGEYPLANLLAINGELYGTTYQGGIYPGWGVVFKVTTAGAEHVMYRFKANNDGAHPYYAELASLNGTLYGTTYQGGPSGGGTVFSVSLAGVEHVLYNFKGQPDGLYPYAGLRDIAGTFYGTTNEGGTHNAGTFYKITP